MKFFAVIFVGLATPWSLAQGVRATADSAPIRLPPTAFSRLPKNVVSFLQRRGCTVPQTYLSRKPHNVVHGEFRRRGQTDWAVLCSRDGESSILVFWRGSTKSVSEIARAPDEGYMQTVAGGAKVGYSRMIEAVGRGYIISHYKSYGGPKPPPIDHQGIDDIYAEKASVVRYRYRGRWLELQGAD